MKRPTIFLCCEFPTFSLLRLGRLVCEVGIIFSNFTKLPNMPKFSATLLAVYSLAQSKISCLKKFFLTVSKEIKNAYICSVKWHKKPQDGHIESVFAVLNRKCGSFQCKRTNEQHSFLVYVWERWHILCRCLTHYRCGALYRLFSFGSFHNPLFDKRESSPHFLFLLLKPYRGCWASCLQWLK